MSKAQRYGNELDSLSVSHDFPSVSVKRSLAGGIAAGIGKTATAPLERLRIIKQAGSSGDGKLISIIDRIYRSEGIKGLWRGNAVNLTRVIPSYAVRFTAFGNLSEYGDQFPILKNPFVVGACAGTASALASYPLEVLRTRISISGSLREAFLKGRFFAGCSLTVLETTPYSALTLGTYNYLRTKYPAQTMTDQVVHGFTAGALGTIICFPVDTLRRNKMVRPTEGVRDIAVSLLEAGGVRRYYRGLPVAVTKAAPTVAVTMLLNDYILLKLGVTYSLDTQQSLTVREPCEKFEIYRNESYYYQVLFRWDIRRSKEDCIYDVTFLG